MNQKNQFIEDVALTVGPLLLVAVAVTWFKLPGGNSDSSELPSNLEIHSTPAAPEPIKRQQFHHVRALIEESGNVEAKLALPVEARLLGPEISTENPFKDVVSDTSARVAAMPDTPEKIIHRRTAKTQWLADLEAEELKALAAKVKEEAASRGIAIEFNSDYDIVAARPIQRAGSRSQFARSPQSK